LCEYLYVWPNISSSSFYILHKADKEIVGYIRFQLDGGIAYSLYKAPFGSFSISEKVDFETFNEFIFFILDNLKNTGIQKIIIKHYPGFYQSNTSELIISSLGLNGFRISKIDINHYIKVSGSSFSSIIHPMELRNLNKCKKAGLVFNEHLNKEAALVFNSIESFRKARNIPINLNVKTLIKLVHTFPDKYKFYSVTLNNEIIAATIVVQVNNSVLYNFLPAHNEVYNSYSPMIFLMDRIYHYAFTNNFKFIDLGISSIEGKAQNSLIKFKERLGSIATSKLSFIKEM
jgi:hypothetical protein